MKQAQRGAPGRRRTVGDKRSQLLTVRLDDTTKALLSAAAEKKQSTVSREAAERLFRSFATDEAMRADFDHPENRGFSTLVIELDRRLRQRTGLSWRDDPYTWREFAAGIQAILQVLPCLWGFSGSAPSVPPRLAQTYASSPRALINDAPDIPAPGQIGRDIAADLLEVLPSYGGVPMRPHHQTGFLREYYEMPQIAHDLRIAGAQPDD